MMRWEITIEAWPHSTGKGQDEDQKACGARSQEFYTRAETIDDALVHANIFATGMVTNPRMWQARVMSIRRVEA